MAREVPGEVYRGEHLGARLATSRKLADAVLAAVPVAMPVAVPVGAHRAVASADQHAAPEARMATILLERASPYAVPVLVPVPVPVTVAARQSQGLVLHLVAVAKTPVLALVQEHLDRQAHRIPGSVEPTVGLSTVLVGLALVRWL